MFNCHSLEGIMPMQSKMGAKQCNLERASCATNVARTEMLAQEWAIWIECSYVNWHCHPAHVGDSAKDSRAMYQIQIECTYFNWHCLPAHVGDSAKDSRARYQLIVHRSTANELICTIACSHAASISAWKAFLLWPSMVAALIIFLYGPWSSAAIFLNTATRASHGISAHALRAFNDESMAIWTSFSPALW